MDDKESSPATVELSVSDIDHIRDRQADKEMTREINPVAQSPAPAEDDVFRRRSSLPDEATADIIDGRYQVVQNIGTGAMGAVFLVRHLRLNKLFALKMVNPDLARRPEYEARFEREADACSRLDHPNCIRVTDFGHTADNQLYLVMEYVDGVPLSDIAKDTPVPLKEALTYTRHILQGLVHAHGKGLIHRDIKLENLLRCETAEGDVLVKILDFGMAKPADDDKESLSITRQGIVLGTPQYIAPEQLNGEKVDERCDLYAVGVTLHRMLTGKPVFAGDTMVDMMTSKISRPAPLLNTMAPVKYPAALEAFLMRALSRSPERRFQSAVQMLQELEKVANGIDRRIFAAKGDRPASPVTVRVVAVTAAAVLLIGGAIVVAWKAGLLSDAPEPLPAPIAAPVVSAAEEEPPAPPVPPPAVEEPVPDELSHPVLLEARLQIERGQCPAARRTLEAGLPQMGDSTAAANYLLGRSSMCMGRPADALTWYRRAIEADDRYRRDGALIEDVKEMLSMRNVSDDAMDFMKDTLKDAALPTLIHLAGHARSRELRHSARAHVEAVGMGEHINMEASLDWDLNQAGSCEEKRAIIARLAALGSERARLLLIRARDQQEKAGFFKKKYTHACVRDDITRALSAFSPAQ